MLLYIIHVLKLLAKEGAYYDLEVPVAVALQRRTEVIINRVYI